MDQGALNAVPEKYRGYAEGILLIGSGVISIIAGLGMIGALRKQQQAVHKAAPTPPDDTANAAQPQPAPLRRF